LVFTYELLTIGAGSSEMLPYLMKSIASLMEWWKQMKSIKQPETKDKAKQVVLRNIHHEVVERNNHRVAMKKILQLYQPRTFIAWVCRL
jgi:hypothetical protein